VRGEAIFERNISSELLSFPYIICRREGAWRGLEQQWMERLDSRLVVDGWQGVWIKLNRKEERRDGEGEGEVIIVFPDTNLSN
jgi:hypothetical protein